MEEPKDHACPCCLQPVTRSEHARVTALLAAAATTHANGFEWCRECGGPVEKGRETFDRPTCYRCLPPPAPLRVLGVDEAPAAPSHPGYATLSDRDDWRARVETLYSREVAPVADVVIALQPEPGGEVTVRFDKVRGS